MNLPNNRRDDSPAFTLAELLVSLAVLALMVAMIAHLTNGAAFVVGKSGKHMDSDTQARLVFNRMALDFARMVKRPDVDFSTFKHPGHLQVGNDRFAFYSEADGYFSGNSQPSASQKAPMSLVAYRVAADPDDGKPVLRRMGKGLGWEPKPGAWKAMALLPRKLTDQWPDLANSNDPDPDYRTVGDQVFRLEINYLLKPSSTQAARLSTVPWGAGGSSDGLKDVAAVIVTIAVLDHASRGAVQQYDLVTDLLSDAIDGQSPGAAWNAEIAKPGFSERAGLPAASAAAVRVYERYFSLSSP